jgi:hypothetical protein
VAIIHRGRVVAQGAVADLERGDRLRLAVRVAGDPAGGWARRLDSRVATVERVDAGGTVLLVLAPDGDSQRVLDAARAAGAVEHFSFAIRRLSEVFREVTGEDASELEGRGADWTPLSPPSPPQERGTSDEGRRRLWRGPGRWVGARKRAGDRA